MENKLNFVRENGIIVMKKVLKIQTQMQLTWSSPEMEKTCQLVVNKNHFFTGSLDTRRLAAGAHL